MTRCVIRISMAVYKEANMPSKKNNHYFWEHAVTTLEKEASWAYQQFKHSLPKKWEKRLDHWSANDIIQLAFKKRNQIAKEVKCYADGIVHTLSGAHILPNRNKLVKEAKQNLQGFVKKIQKTNVAHEAIKLASNKGSEFLSLLNFPTKKDVSKLNLRLNQLEKKLKSLGQKTQPM